MPSTVWRASGEFLYLTRDNSTRGIRFITGLVSGTNVDSDQLDFAFDPGFAIGIERETACGKFFQVGYSQVQWQADFLTDQVATGDEYRILAIRNPRVGQTVLFLVGHH